MLAGGLNSNLGGRDHVPAIVNHRTRTLDVERLVDGVVRIGTEEMGGRRSCC
jgi:hypothetical protein